MAVSFAAWLATIAGCAHDESIEVRGTVTLAGKPVANAAVLFVADSGGRPAVGTTDAQGAYRLQLTSGNSPPAGRYLVAVTAIDAPDAPSGEFESATEEVMAEISRPRRRPRWRTPPRYADPQTSGLDFEVNAETDNVADFDLKP
ncbi:MAG: hypothetical protein CMJ58_00070 [Planctomycetaceae bacterium]|nr:hypothetical protein [Planctomycetaceae bacterium]